MHLYLIIGLLLAIVLQTEAQQHQGYVIDVLSQDSLANVHVVNVTRTVGTFTDGDGHFSIPAQNSDSLRFSRVGYQPQVVSVDQLTPRVAMIPDTVLLSEVRVLANRVNMYRDTSALPIRLPGVPYVENPQAVEPISWTWGQKNFSDNSPSLPTVGVSASLAGAISYLLGDGKDERKYRQLQREERAQQGLRQVINEEKNRQWLMDSFQLTPHQYDSLLIIFNQRHAALMTGASQEEVLGKMLLFFGDVASQR